MNWSEQSQKQKQQEEHNLFDRWDKPPAAPIRRASETQNVFQDYQPRHNSTNDGWPDVSNRPNVSKSTLQGSWGNLDGVIRTAFWGKTVKLIFQINSTLFKI